MSSRTKVSKQVKITQGNEAIIFELSPRGLMIAYGEVYREQQTVATEATRFVLKKPGMDALRELLGMQQPLNKRTEYKGEKPLTLPAEEFDERFKKGQPGPPREPDGTPTPEGLSRKADGVEEGMGE